MRVAAKIILVAVLGFLPILAAHAWFSIEREERLFRSDMQRDLSLLGSHLREVAVAQWRRAGSDGVDRLLSTALRADSRVALEWNQREAGVPALVERDDNLVWVEPIVVDGKSIGAIVLSEPMAPMRDYLRATVVRMGLLMGLLISGGIAVAFLLSRGLIGQRLDKLVQFAAETGAGRFGREVDVGGHDEITSLGSSLSEMSMTLARVQNDAERMYEERLEMLQHLRHADRLASVGRLAGSVAHELGTPLNVVMGHANRIAARAQPGDVNQESAATIHKQVKRMEATIRDILGFVRKSPAEEERVDLEVVAESVCELLKPIARRQKVSLEVEGRSKCGPVWGHRIHLEQAVSNLVTNAIDASPHGGRVWISLKGDVRPPSANASPQHVAVVRVRDEGPGVSEASRAQLFEAFYTSKASGQGTGLGLWLADGIVRDHGGSIELETCREGGACFAVILPESDES